jgi:DNA segregation ATPase FtsK/SpoIIIE, S-DNA-T family
LDDLDEFLAEDWSEQKVAASDVRTSSSYAQSSAFVQAPIQHHNTVSTSATVAVAKEVLSKEAFIEAWQDTAGKPQEEDFDFDAPLTDASGRPMSLSMQIAERRRDLSPLPGLDLLDEVDLNKKVNFTAEQLARLSELLEIKLQEFNVKAKVVEAQPGPVVTRFELDLAPGVKASKVTNISRDLARSMSMASVRVVEVIPGKPYIGIEVPNSTREMVRLIELLTIPAFTDPNSILSMAMGKDISGNPVIADLGKAPHMLVAGTTGSGKSVAVNSMILSMLLKYTPNELRLILIDPKQLELANYNDIPHLLTPVVTDMKDAVSAFIADDEVNRICDAWRERGSPNYVDEILTPFDEEPSSRGFEDGDGDPNRDALYDQCVSFVLETRKVSVSSLQRKFSLGYNRAARIVDQMEENGIVSAQGANGKREILV